MFNVNLLYPTANNLLPRQIYPLPLLIKVEGIKQFNVKEVVNLF